MSSITQGQPDVTVEQLAKDITEQLLQPRRTFMARVGAPRNRYVGYVRTGISCQRSKPVEKMLAVAMADVDDGIPVSLAIRPFESIIEILKARAEARAAKRPDTTCLRAVMRLESRAQERLDEAQHDVLAEPDNADVYDRLLVESANYDAAQERMNAVARRRLAELDLKRKATVGNDR